MAFLFFFVSVCNIKNSFIDDYALDSEKNCFFYFSANFARGILLLCTKGNSNPCLIDPQRGFLPPDLFHSIAIASRLRGLQNTPFRTNIEIKEFWRFSLRSNKQLCSVIVTILPFYDVK